MVGDPQSEGTTTVQTRIGRLKLELSEGQERLALEHMTFRAYRHLLDLQPGPRLPGEVDSPPIQPLAIRASEDGRPVGLALAELPLTADREPELLSVFVEPKFRGRGVGTRLMERAAQEVDRAGFSRLRAVYNTGTPGGPIVEHLFEKCGWQTPVLRSVTVRFTPEEAMRVPWLDKVSLPPQYEIFPWLQITESERNELRRSHEESPWIAEDLLPWDYETESLEPITSLGLRYKGRIVGWVLNHRIDEETIRYTCSFIRKPLGRMGRILPLFSESLRRLDQAGCTNCTFVTPLFHKGMASFARRWIGPYVSSIQESKGSVKVLRAE